MVRLIYWLFQWTNHKLGNINDKIEQPIWVKFNPYWLFYC